MAVQQTLTAPSLRRGSWGRPVLFSLAALWLLSRFLPGGDSERLRDLPPGAQPLAARGGELLLTGERSTIGLEGLSVQGDSRRVLVPSLATSGIVRETFFTPAGAIFQVEEAAEAPARPWAGFFGGAGYRTRLWTASLNGSPARELLPELRMERAVPSGDTCFWLRPAKHGERTGGQTAHTRSLMATPLHGGSSHVIAQGLSAATQLQPLGGGVTWSVPRRDMLHSDRYLALPPEFRSTVVPDCFGRPTLAGGRLYWLQFVLKPFGPGAPGPAQLELTSARVDGSDRRVILDLLATPEWSDQVRLLGEHRGRVYSLLYKKSRRDDEAKRPTLCQVTDAGVRPLTTLPADAGYTWLDGEYLYYTTHEQRDRWWDWSPAGLNQKSVAVLRRTRLRD